MNLPDFYSYTAVFSHDYDKWLMNFPDLEHCSTNADSLDEAIIQANNIQMHSKPPLPQFL